MREETFAAGRVGIVCQLTCRSVVRQQIAICRREIISSKTNGRASPSELIGTLAMRQRFTGTRAMSLRKNLIQNISWATSMLVCMHCAALCLQRRLCLKLAEMHAISKHASLAVISYSVLKTKANHVGPHFVFFSWALRCYFAGG